MSRQIAKVVEVQSPWLTVEETQKYLGFGTANVQRRWRDSGKLPYYVICKKIFYKMSDVDRFVERHRIGK